MQNIADKEVIVSVSDATQISEGAPSAEFSSTRFLKITFIYTILIAVLLVGVNIYFDIYGLFRPIGDRSLSIYYNERLSKYLLSYHYIPEKFNAVVIGTSLSANIDVGEFNRKQDRIHVYNASLMGANVSEITPVLNKIVDGGITKVIICFSPYMIKNSGSKEIEFGPKLYFGALGSKNLYETYLVGTIRKYNLMPNKFPANQIDEFGVNHFGSLYKVNNVKEMIAKVIKADPELKIDSVALQEMKTLIGQLKAKHVDFIGYFHPVPSEVLASKTKEYERFQRIVTDLVNDSSRIVNFNRPEFASFTSDYSNYIDHGHLSNKGQKVIFDSLSVHLTGLFSK